jgi:hypothetical protein
MPTKNPKVSAYIPQHIFDRFQSFCQEKGMSMSQATAVVFAGYFEIEPEVNHLSGLLADRIRDLELKLSELSSSTIELSKELISELKSELTSVLLKEIQSSTDVLHEVLLDRLKSELKGGLQKESENKLPNGSASEPQLESFDTRGSKQLGLEVEQKPLTEPVGEKPSRPRPKRTTSSKKPKDVVSPNGKDILTAAQLAERFKCASSLPSKQKGRYKDESEKFVSWSKGKDPDGFSWNFKEGSTLYYRVEPLA